MPPALIAPVLAGITGLAATSTAVVVASQIISLALVAGLSFGAQKLLAPKASQPVASRSIDNLKDIARTNALPARIVFGRAKLSGLLVYAASVDSRGRNVEGGRFLHLVLALCEGPIAGVREIVLNDKPSTDVQYRNKAQFIAFPGFTDQEAVQDQFHLGPFGASEPPLKGPLNDKGERVWTEQHRLRGIAYIYGILFFNYKVFPQGAPSIQCVVDGLLVWDPRDPEQSPYDETTWQWSDNLALCILAYLRDRRWGMGVRLADIDLPSFIAEANVADELVEVPVGEKDEEGNQPTTTQRRYTCNGIFATDAKHEDVLGQLLSAGAGRMPYAGGKFYLRLGHMASPIVGYTLDANDLRGAIEMVPKPSRTDAANRIEGTFVNADKDWQPDSFPPVFSDTYKREDGGRTLTRRMDFPFVTNVYQALRLARMELRQARQGVTFKAECNIRPLQAIVWDVVPATFADFGWSSKLFRIVELELGSDANGVDLTLSEYSDSVYDDSEDLPVIDPAPDTTLPSGINVAPPRELSVREAIGRGPSGERLPRLIVFWQPPRNVVVYRYRVRWQHVAWFEGSDAPKGEAFTEDPGYTIPGLVKGTYRVEVSTQNRVGAESRARRAFGVITFRTLPPPDPTAFFVRTNVDGSRTFSWSLTDDEPPDIREYEIRTLVGTHGDDLQAEWEAATVVWRGRQSSVTLNVPKKPGDYTGYVRARDTYGLDSLNPAFLNFTVPSSRLAEVLYEEDVADSGWPGVIVDGRINTRNELEPDGQKTWADAGTFDTPGLRWNSDPLVVEYNHPTIDLDEPTHIDATVDVDSDGGDVDVGMAVRQKGETKFDPYGRVRPVTNVEAVRFRVRLTPSGTRAPRIRNVTIAVFRRLDEERADNLNLADYVSSHTLTSLVRIETGSRWSVNEQSHRLVRRGDALECEKLACPEFNGSSGYVSIPSASEIQLLNAFTVECMLRPLTYSQASKTVLAKSTNYGISYDNGTVSWSSSGHSGDDPTTDMSFAWPDAFGWHHLAFSYRSSAGAWFAALDGEYAAGPFERNFTLAVGGADLILGAASAAAGFLGCALAEVRIWKRGLTLEEIRLGMAARPSSNAPGLVGYWRLDDGLGATAVDRALVRHNGTYHGGYTPVHFGSRESEALDLDVIGYHGGFAGVGSVARRVTLPASTSIDIEYSRDRVTWTAANDDEPLGTSLASSFYPLADLAGEKFYLRQRLRSTVLGTSPRLESLRTQFPTLNYGYDFLYRPQLPFASIDQAIIAAIQRSDEPLVWDLLGRTPYGARFRVRQPDGDPTNERPLVDITIRGQRLAA